MTESFSEFKTNFIKEISKKSTQLNKMLWILETTGSKDAADLFAQFYQELKLLFSDKKKYEKLLSWQKELKELDELSQRELTLLIMQFKQNMIDRDLLQKMSEKEAHLMQLYANFRPKVDDKELSENQIRKILNEEKDVEKRKKVWIASKQIGHQMAKGILELVELRNQAAKSLGYTNYFDMQLDLQEVDKKWLFDFLQKFHKKSEKAYDAINHEINETLCKNFKVANDQNGPWLWKEPFGQEDPLAEEKTLDPYLKKVDYCEVAKKFYEQLGLSAEDIIQRSDMLERSGKNQHAFCINIDRKQDVRTLNNLQPTTKWLETLLHELGHGVYEKGYDDELSWLLRDPPHMITTEAMALIMGRQAYKQPFYEQFIGVKDNALFKRLERSAYRRQMIFSRWVLVMTYFENELYNNPKQNLNKLWWELVEKYQKIPQSLDRSKDYDWAAKYHIGLAPVYYYSYLLGEFFASSMERQLLEGKMHFYEPQSGAYFSKKLFAPGCRWPWDKLVKHVIDKPLTDEDWIYQYAH